MIEKRNLRKQMGRIRLSLSETEQRAYDNLIFNHIIQLKEYEVASQIYTYVDFNHEVNTKKIILHALAQGKQLAVPKVEGSTMEFYLIKGLHQLKPGAYGILEPVTNTKATSSGFMIIPGLAFDKKKHRLGYGGGFYDKYLKEHTGLYKAGLSYECQLLEEIIYETHDVSLDCIITEKGIY